MSAILKNIFDRPTTLHKTLQTKFSGFYLPILFLKLLLKKKTLENTVCYEHLSKKLKNISTVICQLSFVSTAIWMPHEHLWSTTVATVLLNRFY